MGFMAKVKGGAISAALSPAFLAALIAAALAVLSPAPLAAQDGFGFGAGEDDPGGFGFGETWSGGSLTVSTGGEVSAALTGYVKEFSDNPGKAEPGNLVEGRLNFSAAGSNAEALINLKLTPVFDGSSPITVNEAYVRGFFGQFDLEAGLRKIAWGRADIMGPLDVINPLDYRDFSALSDIAALKIPRPLVHASYYIGSFTKLEGVFVPWFEGHRFAMEGRWAPKQMDQLGQMLSPNQPLALQLAALSPSVQTLEYAQGGARFTTSIGPVDMGLQYYYGNLFQPAYKIELVPNPDPNTVAFAPVIPALTGVNYNRYHQIGLDYAQVIAGFNLRAEAAANITEDLEGDDGAVYNPALLWSLGFDRGLVWGITLNVEGLGSVRLLDDKISSPMDIEADTDVSATRIILTLTKSFFRDTLELRASGIWEVEARDFTIMPAVTWTKDDIVFSLSCGIFGGDEDGQFGQYRDQAFIKLGMTYTF